MRYARHGRCYYSIQHFRGSQLEHRSIYALNLRKHFKSCRIRAKVSRQFQKKKMRCLKIMRMNQQIMVIYSLTIKTMSMLMILNRRPKIKNKHLMRLSRRLNWTGPRLSHLINWKNVYRLIATLYRTFPATDMPINSNYQRILRSFAVNCSEKTLKN